jgi:transcriptional regulator with XRE-family HTH domain
MSAEATALVQRRVRQEIRRQRSQCELTQQQVADAMGWSVSKLIRMEQGSVKVSPADLYVLLKHYGRSSELDMDGLVHDVRTTYSGRPYWYKYRSVTSPEFREFLAFESVASQILLWNTTLIPGLLQTAAYMERIFVDVLKIDDPVERQKRTSLRLQRQASTFGRDERRVQCLLDESVLRRRIGTRADFREQLQHLLAQGSRPGVCLQVVPMDVGAHPGLMNSYVLIEAINYLDHRVLYVEGAFSQFTIRENPGLINASHRDFLALEKLALGVQESKAMIHGIIEEL